MRTDHRLRSDEGNAVIRGDRGDEISNDGTDEVPDARIGSQICPT